MCIRRLLPTATLQNSHTNAATPQSRCQDEARYPGADYYYISLTIPMFIRLSRQVRNQSVDS
jgi:hypothetical protein